MFRPLAFVSSGERGMVTPSCVDHAVPIRRHRFLAHPPLLAELDGERYGRVLQWDGGSHDLRITPVRRHPSDRSADRDVWWSKYTFPSDRRSAVHAELVAPGSLARRPCACWRMAH